MLSNLILGSKTRMSVTLKPDLWTGISIRGSKAVQEFISVYTLGSHDQILVARDYRGHFCEQLPEASPMSHGDSASWFQEGSTSGQGQAHQRWWLHLWDNIVKTGKKFQHKTRQHKEWKKKKCQLCKP